MLYLGAKAQSKNSCGTKQISLEILAGIGVLIKRFNWLHACLSSPGTNVKYCRNRNAMATYGRYIKKLLQISCANGKNIKNMQFIFEANFNDIPYYEVTI